MTTNDGHRGILDTLSTMRRVGPRRVAAAAAVRSWGENVFFGLSVDLASLAARSGPTGDFAMEPRTASEFDGFDVAAGDAPAEETPELLARMRLCRSNVATLYVGSDTNAQPVYAQWLVSPSEQSAAARLLAGTRILGPRESLVEGAYTFPCARGRGVMREGMGQLLEIARARGDDRVLTYVHEGNVPSLRGCAAVGFDIDHVRLETWRAGHLRMRFEPMTSAHRTCFSALTAPRRP